VSFPKLELFYYEECPFCQFVLQTIKKLNILVEYKNIREDSANLNKLLNDTGRRTTPCLYINNRPMFESSDIVSWLNQQLENLEKRQSK